jgi:16S rRNA processing protein RimM
MTAPGKRVVVGRITTAYGVRGWLKVHAFTEQPTTLLTLPRLYYRQSDDWRPLPLDAGRAHGKGLVVHVAGTDDRDQARALTGSEIGVAAEDLPPLAAGEFYWHQLEGLQVRARTDAGEVLLGRVHHLLETGSNDVLVVRPCAGSLDRRERLIPYLPDRVVENVDLAADTLWVDWDPAF